MPDYVAAPRTRSITNARGFVLMGAYLTRKYKTGLTVEGRPQVITPSQSPVQSLCNSPCANTLYNNPCANTLYNKPCATNPVQRTQTTNSISTARWANGIDGLFVYVTLDHLLAHEKAAAWLEKRKMNPCSARALFRQGLVQRLGLLVTRGWLQLIVERFRDAVTNRPSSLETPGSGADSGMSFSSNTRRGG